MRRIVFLILVLVGALALVMGLIVGVGAMQLAATNAPIEPTPTTAPMVPAPGMPGPSLDAPAAAPVAIAPAAVIPAPLVVKPVLAVDWPVPVVVAPQPERQPFAATALSIARADNCQPLLALTEGMTVDLSSLQTKKYTLRAEVAGTPKSVRFIVDDGKLQHLEHAAPYTIAGDDRGNNCTPFPLTVGEHVIAVTPFSAAEAKGDAGRTLYVRFRVTDPATQVRLTAASATLHGETLQLEGKGDDRAAAFWRTQSDYLDWKFTAPRETLYKVELTYACDASLGGGEYEIFVGDHRFTGTPEATRGWQDYRTIEVGQLTLRPGETRITIKPVRIGEGRALMNVRSVHVTPIK